MFEKKSWILNYNWWSITDAIIEMVSKSLSQRNEES